MRSRALDTEYVLHFFQLSFVYTLMRLVQLVRVKHLIDRALEVYSIIIVANDRTSLVSHIT